MSTTKFSRRLFLGGAGAAVALPFLESLRGRKARGGGAEAPKRFLGYYVPCGMVMNNWTPAATGAGWVAKQILQPLDTPALRPKVSILSGLDNRPGRSEGGGDHAAGTGSFLTCTHVRKTAGSDILNNISLDQVLAPVLSEGLSYPSLELGTDGGSAVGDCDTGYSCAYARSISWAGPTTPLPKQTTPRAVFDRLFAGYDAEATAAEIAKRQLYRTSVLDHAVGQAGSLRTQLGKTDQAKLDEYLTSVRELEVRVATPPRICMPGTRPADNLSFAARARAMADLMVVAFQCDLTRVITFMLGNAGSGATHPQVGVTESHHEISHHMMAQSNFDKLTLIEQWEVGELAYLLGRLDAVEDSPGVSVLDNSIVFFSSEIEDGDAHRHTNLPVVMAGGGAGTMIQGTHTRFPTGTPLANLFLSFLQALGAPQARFGDDGTAALTQVMA
jgi:hypothetical protein